MSFDDVEINKGVTQRKLKRMASLYLRYGCWEEMLAELFWLDIPGYYLRAIIKKYNLKRR